MTAITRGGHRGVAANPSLIGFGAFAALAVFNVVRHSPWRDELQALLIAEASRGPLSLFHNLAYEGHPGLWHALIGLASLLHSGPDALKIVQVPVALAILGLLWFRSPFSVAEKALLSAGYYLLFEYTVIARGYGLGVALFFAFVVWRERPVAWLFLGLMANITIHFGMLAGLCGLLLLYWGNRSRWGIACAVLLALIAAVTAFPAPDVVSAMDPKTLSQRAQVTMLRLSGALLPLGWRVDPLYRLLGTAMVPLRGLLSGFVIAGGVLALKPRRDLQLAFLGVCASLYLIGTLIFVGFDRHYGIIWIALIGLCWIAKDDRRQPASAIFIGWAAISVLATAVLAVPLVTQPFSGGMAAAKWIERHDDGAIVACFPASSGVAITAVTGKPTFNLREARWSTYTKWNYVAYKRASGEQLAAWVERASSGPVLLVRAGRFVIPSTARVRAALARHGRSIRLVVAFPGEAEPYLVYRISGAKPSATR